MALGAAQTFGRFCPKPFPALVSDQIGIPIHQGYRGIKEDEGKMARTIANLLSPTDRKSVV